MDEIIADSQAFAKRFGSDWIGINIDSFSFSNNVPFQLLKK
jgi:hypothetical protein